MVIVRGKPISLQNLENKTAENSCVPFSSNIPQTLRIVFGRMALLINLLFTCLVNGRPSPVMEAITRNGSLLYNLTVESNDPSSFESETEFQQSVHLSTALACLVAFVFIIFYVRTSGYQLSSNFCYSTDCWTWMTTLAISVFWTTFVLKRQC